MTISSTVTKAIYGGNGSTTVFAVPFMFNDKKDIEVVLTDVEGYESLLTISTDYQLSGEGESAGGTCTLSLPPEAGQTLVIRRNPAIIQEVDYVENDAFPAATHEAALDKLTMICQTLSERLDRTISFRVSSAVSGAELPEPAPGQMLAWNETGDNLTNKVGTEIEGFGNALLPLGILDGGTGATNANDALTNLGFSAIGSAVATSADTATALTALDAQPADPATLKADKSGTLTVGYTALAQPMVTAAPTPATGALQTIDTTGGAVPLEVPVAAGIIRFVVTGSEALNISASYDSISGSYDTGVGLAQGEIVSDGTNHFITLINKAG